MASTMNVAAGFDFDKIEKRWRACLHGQGDGVPLYGPWHELDLSFVFQLGEDQRNPIKRFINNAAGETYL